MNRRVKRLLFLVVCLALLLPAISVFAQKKYTLGISNFRDSFEFCARVHQNIEEWAKKYGFKTVYAEANMEPEKVKANLDTFAIQGVDAIFEFNWLTDVTAKWMKENPGIVMVTGDYVVPGAYYFGANQYQAGVVLGKYLAEQVKKRWGGQLDAMVFAACYQCGELLIKRMDGILDGYKETYKNFPDNMVFRFENNNPTSQQPMNTQRIVTDFYTAHPKMTHIVVGTNNDEGGMGALAAVETMGKQANFFIVSHGGDAPFQEKLRAGKGDVWIGSVAYMPERYGEFMIPWLKDILDNKPNLPKEMSPEHFVLTKENIDKYYPKK
jgi:ribose transport system substrate-binding protein